MIFIFFKKNFTFFPIKEKLDTIFLYALFLIKLRRKLNI